ncbi:MAG: EAL domain-containing protein [Lachnospiraceae bacterium]|nr:EAL domain-containing protein [Lachnospiraceae bacterium]
MPQNKLYISITLIVMTGAATSAASVYAGAYRAVSPVAAFAEEAVSLLYFLTHAALGPLIFTYVIYINGTIHHHRKRRERFVRLMIPFILNELVVLSNPFTRLIFTVDAQDGYRRGMLMPLLYLIAGFYYVYTIADLMRYWNAVTPKCRKGLLYLFGVTFLGIAVQLLLPDLPVENFAEAMALMCVMVFIESDEDRMDVTSGLFNRSALNLDLNNYIRMEQEFSVTVVYVVNADVLNRLTGSVRAEGLVGEVAAYLRTIMPYYHIYKTSPTCFALVGLNMSREETREQVERIRERFTKPWQSEEVEVQLGALVMQAGYPSDISSAEEVFLMTDTPVPTDAAGKVRKEAGVNALKRSAQVEQAIRRGFAGHYFEVYYQPVYFLDNLSIHSAEALIRLHDPVLGDVSPAEFIPVAEHDGIIDEIGNFVLEEACLFLSSGLPVEMGIEYISVNLSILQCMRPGFTKYARELTEHYDISPSLICFEIKEEAAATDFSILQDMITELREFGFRFSMDGYGTGFSDMKALYTLDFEVIKIDRVILNRAGTGEVGRIVLESCVRMIRQMRRRILVEGVETREQIEMLKKLDVDYVQGYYSSRPITKNELLGILRVTELARMEERRAIAASEAKSSFLANMSHEIRTPINAVLGMNEVILRECDEPEVMRYAKEIETAGRNLLALINNILDYSKIEAGEMEIVEENYDLKQTLGDVIKDIYRKTTLKQLNFRVYVSEDLPAVLHGDEFRLKQVMTNLLNNAVKYTDKGSVQLTVEGEYYSEEEVLLRISVEDTGCGIREEDQSKLYEMFQRLDMERNRTVEGTGLGLAISYHLLQMMQGEIEVQSEYGRGSRFTVQLLQKTVGKEKITPFRPDELRSIYSGLDGPKPFAAPAAKILIVDDTPMNHVVMKELLKASGVQIETALSGEEGLNMAAGVKYDMIFLDERMPGLSGRETLRRLRENAEAKSSGTAVISMTANAYPGILEDERKAGFDDYIGKPVDSRKLSELLLEYLPENKIRYG